MFYLTLSNVDVTNKTTHCVHTIWDKQTQIGKLIYV